MTVKYPPRSLSNSIIFVQLVFVYEGNTLCWITHRNIEMCDVGESDKVKHLRSKIMKPGSHPEGLPTALIEIIPGFWEFVLVLPYCRNISTPLDYRIVAVIRTLP